MASLEFCPHSPVNIVSQSVVFLPPIPHMPFMHISQVPGVASEASLFAHSFPVRTPKFCPVPKGSLE